MLSKHHPRLKGQPMTKKFSMSSDDDILKCAITVKEKVNIVVSNSLLTINIFVYSYTLYTNYAFYKNLL